MSHSRSLLWATSAITLLSIAARSSAADRPGRAAQPLSPAAAIDLVHQIYDKASRFTAASGTPARFAVSDCRALYRADFPREAFSELFDLPAVRVLRLSAAVLSDRGLGVSGANFQAHWADAEEDGGAQGVAAATRGASIAAVLADLGAEDRAFARSIEPIVSCNVSASAEGESQFYRAAFFFAPAEGDMPLFFADHVVQGLDRLAREALPAVRDFAELRRRVAPEGRLFNQTDAATASGCATDQKSGQNPGISAVGLQEHLAGGGHSSNLVLGGTCAETSDCFSHCTPNVQLASCSEYGAIDSTIHRTHQTYSDQHVEGDTESNAPSYCKSALACAVESCPFGLCKGITFSFNASAGVGGGSFTIETGTPLWNGSTSDKFGCPAPIPISSLHVGGGSGHFVPYNRYEPGDGGGGGGGTFGGSGGGGCTWIETTNFTCSNPQDPSTCVYSAYLTCV